MWRPKLNPVTQKRINRFKSLKRSYYSLIILISLYALSLVAELLCNSSPLLVRYNGSWYFPIFAFYPEDEFTGSGLNTRPDYKALEESEPFQEDGNWMLFPPFRYGPNEGATASDLDVEQEISIELSRKLLVGSIDVYQDYKIRRSVAAAGFFGKDSELELRGLSLLDSVDLPSEFSEAVSRRFANEEILPSASVELELAGGTQVQLSLSAYKPRSREPRTVRLSLRERGESGAATKVVVSPQGAVKSDGSGLWDRFSEKQRAMLWEKVEERMRAATQPLELEIDGALYQAEFLKEDIFFPFRPTSQHFMGLDSSGRDVFARTVYAMRISLNFGILLVVVTMVVGVLIGGIQGYFAGKLDLMSQRAIEIWEALPFLYIMILMGSVYGQSFMLLLLVYGLFNWIGISYYMRGEFLKMRKQPFVEAAHCLGLPAWKIMWRHILPNSLVPLITFFPFSLVSAVGALSALDYLGFGLPAPTPSWGEMLAQAQEYRYAWWLVLYPSLTLFVVVLLGVFIGEGVRAAFDPRVNSRYES